MLQIHDPYFSASSYRKVPDISPTIKGRILAVTEESRYVDHVAIDSRMTRTDNKNPRVYKIWKAEEGTLFSLLLIYEQQKTEFYYAESTGTTWK